MKKNVLVVCDGNINRSPTVAKFLQERHSDWEVQHAGLYYGYPLMVTQELVDWSDVIYVMEVAQLKRLHNKFKNIHHVIVLGIPDEYDAFSDELYQEIRRVFHDDRYE